MKSKTAEENLDIIDANRALLDVIVATALFPELFKAEPVGIKKGKEEKNLNRLAST